MANKVLFEPNINVAGVRDRRNALLISRISFAFLLFISIFMIAAIAQSRPPSITDVMSYIIILIVYMFSRTKYYGISIGMMSLLIPANVFINVYLGSTHNVDYTLFFLVIGYGLVTVFMKSRDTIIYVLIVLALLWSLQVVAPSGLLNSQSMTVHLTINVIMGSIVIIANRHREVIERETKEERGKNQTAALMTMVNTLESRHRETAGHSNRVAKLAVELAKRCDIKSEKILNHIYEGALLHDIGKIAIPDKVLLKEGKLTDEEWEIVKQHPITASRLLGDFDFLKNSLVIPLNHHERYDGSGYPTGLVGEDIPIEARIFAIIDVYDALQEKRPYREAFSIEEILEHFNKNRGIKYDPAILDEFMAYFLDSPEVSAK